MLWPDARCIHRKMTTYMVLNTIFQEVAEIGKILNCSLELKEYSLLSSGANVCPKSLYVLQILR